MESKSWSESLQKQTKEHFENMPAAFMKQLGGRFGVCTLLDGVYSITDRETREIETFNSIEDLISAKWAID